MRVVAMSSSYGAEEHFRKRLSHQASCRPRGFLIRQSGTLSREFCCRRSAQVVSLRQNAVVSIFTSITALQLCNMGASLYESINVYKPLARDIGIVDGPLEYLTVGGIRLPLPFTTRMTVVRLSNGDLFLHSPIKFDERLAEELHGLGRVRHLVSPNQFHYAHIG